MAAINHVLYAKWHVRLATVWPALFDLDLRGLVSGNCWDSPRNIYFTVSKTKFDGGGISERYSNNSVVGDAIDFDARPRFGGQYGDCDGLSLFATSNSEEYLHGHAKRQ